MYITDKEMLFVFFYAVILTILNLEILPEVEGIDGIAGARIRTGSHQFTFEEEISLSEKAFEAPPLLESHKQSYRLGEVDTLGHPLGNDKLSTLARLHFRLEIPNGVIPLEGHNGESSSTAEHIDLINSNDMPGDDLRAPREHYDQERENEQNAAFDEPAHQASSVAS